MTPIIGIMGGSFNPVHMGHIMLASHLCQNSDMDEVWLTLSPCNPLKKADTLIDDNQRLEMLNLATENIPDIKVCDVELSMPRPSYTINTLELLRNKFPEKQFKLIIGSDNWLLFDKWKNSERIINEFGVIVYPRPGYDINHILCNGVEYIDAPTINISSTLIREGIATGKNMCAFLPQGVNEYINKHNLYR